MCAPGGSKNWWANSELSDPNPQKLRHPVWTLVAEATQADTPPLMLPGRALVSGVNNESLQF